MKSKKFRKTAVPIMLTMCIILLSGALFKEPELLDKDKKLIDLGKAIEFASRGGNSLTDPNDDGEENESTAPSEDASDITPEERSIIIRITGNKIIEYDGSEYKYNGTNFGDLIQKDNQSAKKVTFKLVDDYADSKYYKQLKRYFQNNDITFICIEIEDLEQS